MTQGERVREVRKTLNLTLEKFGNEIGLKKNSLSQIENGKNELTEGNAKAICREFNVNENWLRTGDGEMFLEQNRKDKIMSFAKRLMQNESEEFIDRFATMLSKLDVSDWEILADVAESLVKHKKD